MRVLHVLDHSIPYVDGYSIRSRHIVHLQKDIGLHPCVLTSPLHRQKWSSNPEVFNGIRYFRISGAGISSVSFLREWQIITRIRKMIEKLHRKETFDIIHAHSPSLNGVAALLASKRIKIPFLYESRALWEDAAIDQKKFTEHSIKYKISRMVETMVFRRAATVTAIADYLINEIRKRGVAPDRIYHIPNGVDTRAFEPCPRNDGILQKYGIDPARSVVLGFIGSFYKFEGLDVLLDAMKTFKDTRPDIKLLLVGGGEDLEHIRNRIANESLANVISTGKVPFEQINDYYSAMDVMVYPRLSERITELTTPLKPLEAMAMEKAVIGSDVGGIRELVEDGVNGILFKASDCADLAVKIVSLTDPLRREALGKEARRFVVREKEWKRIVERYRLIYRKVMQSGGYQSAGTTGRA